MLNSSKISSTIPPAQEPTIIRSSSSPDPGSDILASFALSRFENVSARMR